MGLIIFPKHLSLFPKQRPIHLVCSVHEANSRHEKNFSRLQKYERSHERPIALSGYDEELWDGTSSVSPSTSLSSVEDHEDIQEEALNKSNKNNMITKEGMEKKNESNDKN